MPEFDFRPWRDPDVVANPYAQRRLPLSPTLDSALYNAWRRFEPRPVRHPGDLAEIVSLVAESSSDLADKDISELTSLAASMRQTARADSLSRPRIARVFALTAEISHRCIGLRHHPVQLVGGLTLLSGRLAEMATGEGKTITALLPAVTLGLLGIPVHVVTVNDYLAKRDFDWLRPVYNALGLTVGLIQQGQDAHSRRTAYRCDVTYCTNKEIAFDYLRDRIALNSAGDMRGDNDVEKSDPVVLRGLYFAVVDEADSVLIDEARTPLIISGHASSREGADMYAAALRFASQLRSVADYSILERERSIRLTAQGKNKAAAWNGADEGVWRAGRAREELISQALAALYLFERDKHYVIVDEKVQIVDEFTGRIMPDRTWERGLHPLIEAKEGSATSDQKRTLAQITYQQFFRRYLWLSGMTGTAAEVSRELAAVYDLKVVQIPPHRPVVRQDLGTRVFRTAEAKWRAVVGAIEKAHRNGRPVLIGTRSVAASQIVSDRCKKSGLDHVVLNALQNSGEAEIIANAGRRGMITIATNMAGRGTDIRLGLGVAAAGGMHVILTEFHESMRIDRQLFGRSASGSNLTLETRRARRNVLK
jgi:preprotein translocase subunit SecA